MLEKPERIRSIALSFLSKFRIFGFSQSTALRKLFNRFNNRVKACRAGILTLLSKNPVFLLSLALQSSPQVLAYIARWVSLLHTLQSSGFAPSMPSIPFCSQHPLLVRN